MPIIYKIDVLEELKKNGYSTYRLRKEEIFSETIIHCLRKQEPISFKTLTKLCELLKMQPGDILEYHE